MSFEMLCVASIPDDKMDNSTLKLHLLWKQLMKNKNKTQDDVFAEWGVYSLASCYNGF